MPTTTPKRTLKILTRSATLLVVRVSETGRKSATYYVTPDGDSVRWEKMESGATTYTVTATGCGCTGHKRWSHKTVCRHRAGTACLRERGELT